jgi:HD superfamily phosphohydrolase
MDPALEVHRGVLYAAALLHDLGHAPLSHTGEEMFGTHHEHWSARIIREHPAIQEPLEGFQPGSSEAVAALLEHGSTQRRVIKDLVSSQLDCDRLDYLLRDSYSTGTSYGQLDLERILAALTLAPDGELAIHPKGLMAVEHYLVVRNLMYRSVYNHRLNVVCNWLLEQIIRLARELGPNDVWTDSTMHSWLWSAHELDLESYLANDDLRTGYHLLRWREEAPRPLADLCDRFLNRQLFKAMDVANLSKEKQLECLAQARVLAEAKGLDPSLCCGLRHQQLHGYHPYRGGLRLWNGQQLQALEQSSALVKSLSKPANTSWLIYPKQIGQELKRKVGQYLAHL